jgi:hypothetical protein
MSVSHSGTNFCKRLFRDLGWQDCALNEEPVQDNAFYVGHIRNDDQIERALSLSEKYPLIIPIRHPYRVEESWLRQGRGSSADMLSSYRILVERFLPLNPYILAVDSPKRKEQLTRIAKGLDLPLTTDWEVINAKANTYGMDLKEFNPSSQVQSFTKEIHQFLGKYYGRQRKKVGS